MKTPTFEIVAGTYEEYILGYNFLAKDSQILQSFAAHDHSSSLRSVAVGGHYVASGAADDRIIIYDLKVRKEHCMLTHHEATVNCLQFTSDHSHIISGSADGVLAIVRVGNWQLEKRWDKAHKGSAILDIGIHPSGKLALTLGADCSLRTWNLVKGRQAYIINLNSKSKDARSLNKIIWAEDGVRFILYGGKYTEVWSVETGGLLTVIEHDEKVNSCVWLSEKLILVGYEDGQMASIEINKLSKNVVKAHDGRVKALVTYDNWIVSAASTGEIKVWNKDLEEFAKIDSGCRITCLGIVSGIKLKKEVEDEVVEVVKQIKKKAVKKSSVIVEIEDSDEEYIGHSSKRKHKNASKREKQLNNDIVEELEISKVKKKKRKSANEEIDMDNQNQISDTDKSAGKKSKIKKTKLSEEIKLDKQNEEDLVREESVVESSRKKKKLKESIATNDSEEKHNIVYVIGSAKRKKEIKNFQRKKKIFNA